jgi:hypothetical protein
METGFLLDHTNSAIMQAKWLEGEPQRNLWTGLEFKNRRRLPVTAHRCTRCGLLELFASEAASTLLRPAAAPGGDDPDELLRPADP